MWPRGGKKTKQDVEDAEEEVSPRLFLQQSGVSCHHAAIKKSNGISCPSTCTTAGWPAKARPCRQLAGAMPHPSRRNPCCLQALNADASEAVLRVAREQQAELDAEGRAGHAAGGLLRGQVRALWHSPASSSYYCATSCSLFGHTCSVWVHSMQSYPCTCLFCVH